MFPLRKKKDIRIEINIPLYREFISTLERKNWLQCHSCESGHLNFIPADVFIHLNILTAQRGGSGSNYFYSQMLHGMCDCPFYIMIISFYLSDSNP